MFILNSRYNPASPIPSHIYEADDHTCLHLRLEYWNSNEENMTECAIYSEAASLCFYGNAPPIVTGLMAFKALPVDIKAVALLNYLP